MSALHGAARLAVGVLGLAWTLPNTLVGLAVGLAALPFGARMRLRGSELAFVFDGVPWGPGGGTW